MKKSILALLCVLGCAALVVVAASSNVPGGIVAPKASSGSIDSVAGTHDVRSLENVANYTITVTADTDDGGGFDQVQMQIWDDGVMVASKTHNIAVATTDTISDSVMWTGPLGELAPGLGAVLADLPGGGTLDVVDPYFPQVLGAPVPTTTKWGIAGLVVLVGVVGFLIVRRLF